VNPLKDPIYADTSALVKLVIDEGESDSLAEHLRESNLQLTSSEITEIELLRAVARADPEMLPEALALLGQTVLLPLTAGIRRRAASLKPVSIRSLDAIHLATALEIQADLSTLVSYDNRMVVAARAAGIETHSPGA